MSHLYCRFQSGSASLSGRSSYHPGPLVGWWPHREPVHHDGGDDGAAGSAYGMQKETTENVSTSKSSCLWLSEGHYGCKWGTLSLCSHVRDKTDYFSTTCGIIVVI